MFSREIDRHNLIFTCVFAINSLFFVYKQLIIHLGATNGTSVTQEHCQTVWSLHETTLRLSGDGILRVFALQNPAHTKEYQLFGWTCHLLGVAVCGGEFDLKLELNET